MTRVPLIKLCHRMPLFMPIGRAIPVGWYYRWIGSVAPLIGRFSRHAREQQRYVRQALANTHSPEKRSEVARRNLIYRKWRVCLQVAWPNIAERYQQWVSLEGEEHLIRLASAGKGAILLSGHSFGFSGMAVRTLAQRGYEIVRAGVGREPARRRRRWGQGDYQRWQYIGYDGDYWHRFRVLKQLQQAVRGGALLQIGIRGFPTGSPEHKVESIYGPFFLDRQIIRLIEVLQVPVLPCFVVCDQTGRAVIKIFPELAHAREQIVSRFGSLYAEYLRAFPESANIWKKVVREEEF
jgi:lauroyl/myristoyl acyltransferase